MNVFPLIEAERAEQRNVAKACELLEVSRSAFYEHAKHLPSTRALADDELAKRIEAIHEAYGWPRVHQALRRDGSCASRKRVARLMRQRGLIGRCRRRFRATTIADPDAETKAVDLLKRVFAPGSVELDRTWVGDIERHEALLNPAVMKGHRLRLVAAGR